MRRSTIEKDKESRRSRKRRRTRRRRRNNAAECQTGYRTPSAVTFLRECL